MVLSLTSKLTACHLALTKMSCVPFQNARTSLSSCSTGGYARIDNGVRCGNRPGHTSTSHRSITRAFRIIRRRSPTKIDPRVSRRSTRNCSKRTKSSAFRCMNAPASPALPLTPCSIACPSPRHLRKNSPTSALFSAHSPRPSEIIRNWFRSILAASFRSAITFSHRSIRRYSAMDPLSTCPKASVVLWSCRPTFELMRPTPVSSSAR